MLEIVALIIVALVGLFYWSWELAWHTVILCEKKGVIIIVAWMNWHFLYPVFVAYSPM